MFVGVCEDGCFGLASLCTISNLRPGMTKMNWLGSKVAQKEKIPHRSPINRRAFQKAVISIFGNTSISLSPSTTNATG